MKFIHLSDLHIGKKLNGYSLITDQEYILNQILKEIDSIKPDGIFISGDVYDKSIPPTEAVFLFDYFLTELEKRQLKVFIIYGNHDSGERVSFANKILQNKDIYISNKYEKDIQKITLYEKGNVFNIYLLPFIKPIDVRKYYENEDIKDYNDAVKVVIDDLKIDKSQINIILSHQFLTGSVTCESEEFSVGGMDNVDAMNYYDFDYVALGHLHRAQSVLMDKIRYSGTVLKYSVSEKNHIKSITVVDIDSKDDIKISTIPLKPLRDLREIEKPLQQIIDEESDSDDFIAVVLTDEEEDINAYSILSQKFKNILSLSYKNKRTQQNKEIEISDDTIKKSTLEMFEELYEIQNLNKLSDEQKNVLKDILQEMEVE